MRTKILLFLLMPCTFIFIVAASVKIRSPLAGQENPKDEIKRNAVMRDISVRNSASTLWVAVK
jgi:hypothetical protein